MNTNGDAIPNFELGNARRCLRGIVGTSAILALLLVPGLNPGWLFVLAIIGAYESMTAILNADLVYGVLSLVYATTPTISNEASEKKGVTTPLVIAREQQGYSMVT